jgi:hypothetical protein
VILRPLLMTRVANTVPGAAVVLIGGLNLDSTNSSLVGAAALVAVFAGAILGYRGFQLGIDCSADPIVVHGFLRNRKIQRNAVIEVTYFPALRWRDQRTRLRWTPIVAFAELGPVLPAVARHNEASVERLRGLLRT